MTTKTVDLTPTWSDVLPAILAVLSNPKADHEARKVMYKELGRMADIADRYVISKKIVVQEDVTP